MESVWNDYTDTVIKQITPTIKTKYNVDLNSLMLNPSQFSGKPVASQLGDVIKDVNSEIDKMVESFGTASERLQDDMSKCDSISKRLAQQISLHAKQNNVPLVVPYLLERDVDKEEVIYVDNADDSTMQLAEKLVSMSTTVFTLSAEYKDYSLGGWVFSTPSKTYLLRVNVPLNPVLDLEGARNDITAALESAKDYIG